MDDLTNENTLKMIDGVETKDLKAGIVASSFSYDTENTIRIVNGKAQMDDCLGRIDNYLLLKKLGGGGFGVVYLVKDEVSGVNYALKTLHPMLRGNVEEMERVTENFRLTAKLVHQNIAASHVLHRANAVTYKNDDVRRDLRVSPGDTVMLMAYAPGETLSQWRRKFADKKVPFDTAVEIVRQVASALDYAHKMKVLHRDIKPSNVMIEERDGEIFARVLDFGLASEIRSSMSRISRESIEISGTRPYMAPEQWQGKRQDARSDEYALACMFYELVSGEVPFATAFESGDTGIMFNTVANIEPEELEDASPAVNAAILRALSKERKDRFDTCADFVSALEGKAGTTIVEFAKKKRCKKSAILAFLALVIFGGWWYISMQQKPERLLGSENLSANGVQLWENGPYWATCNVGATSPEECGYYFWWGDTIGYKREGGSWIAADGSKRNFSFDKSNCPTFGKDNSWLRKNGYIDQSGNLVPAHDAATAHLGAPWRMPTNDEIEGLCSKCDRKWTKCNGVQGYLVTGKGAYASKRIFLPAAGGGNDSDLGDLGSDGYYWSSTPNSGYSYYAWDLDFDSGYFDRSNSGRSSGQSVRPVRGFAK